MGGAWGGGGCEGGWEGEGGAACKRRLPFGVRRLSLVSDASARSDSENHEPLMSVCRSRSESLTTPPSARRSIASCNTLCLFTLATCRVYSFLIFAKVQCNPHVVGRKNADSAILPS